MANVAVILSGCGVFDGSEIHESVLTLLYLDRAGADVQFFAPDKPQAHVIDHNQQQTMDETRNVLTESARIARGKVEPLSSLNADNFDAIVLPGGFGAAKNLCTFAMDGTACEIDPDVQRVIRDAHAKKKVIGAMCIAPAVLAKALQGTGVHAQLTIGSDASTAGALREMGSENKPASVSEIVVDEANRIVTTPAYMLGPSIAHIATGIEKLVEKVLDMAGS